MPHVPVFAMGIAALGVQATPEALERLQRYMELLLEWSERMSLTAVRDEEGIQRRHFLESAALIPALAGHGVSLENRSLIDVGSGAGVPGIPLKILEPTLTLTLIEAKQRKAEFLTNLLPELGLEDVTVITRRAEEASHDPRQREQYDFAAAKALAPLRTLLELTLPFVKMGGLVLAPKGKEAENEVKEARYALETLKGSVRAVEAMPGVDSQVLVIVDKELPTPERFPRRPGIPAKRPL